MQAEQYMREALAEAEVGVKEGSAPFAVVVTDKAGTIVWKDHDRVKEAVDPTAHAEVNAIRGLCKKLGSLSLAEHVFYTTSEPCPTCLTAMIKARVSRVVFGAKTEPTASLPIPAEELAQRSKKYPISVTGGILGDECLVQRNKYLGL